MFAEALTAHREKKDWERGKEGVANLSMLAGEGREGCWCQFHRKHNDKKTWFSLLIYCSIRRIKSLEWTNATLFCIYFSFIQSAFIRHSFIHKHSLMAISISSHHVGSVVGTSMHCNENPIYVYLFWELRGWETEHYNSVSEIGFQVYFWKYINGILDSHRSFSCSMGCRAEIRTRASQRITNCTTLKYSWPPVRRWCGQEGRATRWWWWWRGGPISTSTPPPASTCGTPVALTPFSPPWAAGSSLLLILRSVAATD